MMFGVLLQESLHATGSWYSVSALPSCAPLIPRVGLLSNLKPPVGVSATSPRTHSGINRRLLLCFSFCLIFCLYTKLNQSTASIQACTSYLFLTLSLDSSPCPFLFIRHRLEEGQASSWSRRLKFFMCCTRAQDTQSVSHNTYPLPLRR